MPTTIGGIATSASAFDGTEVFELEQGGVTVKGTTMQAAARPTTAFAYAASPTLNTSTSLDWRMSDDLDGNMAITLSNGATGRHGTIAVRQDGTGTRTVSVVGTGATAVSMGGSVDLAADAATLIRYAFVTIDGVLYLFYSMSNVTASETVAGLAEAATTAEINTGTDPGRFLAPDQFAASVFGTAVLCIPIGDSATSAAVADGTWGVAVPSSMNGMNVVNVIAVAYTAGVTGTTEFQLRRRRAGASADVLSTRITMAAQTVCSDGVINASNDDLATGDILYADVDVIETTAPLGVQLIVEARLP